MHTHTKLDKYSVHVQHSKSPSLQLYGVTRGQLPQRAGLPGLNGGGAAAAVPPPKTVTEASYKQSAIVMETFETNQHQSTTFINYCNIRLIVTQV